MFPNQDHGRMMVTEDGSLIIDSVEKQDGGEYICKGLSAAGSAYAKAKLEVRGRPAYWIYRTASVLVNQTLGKNGKKTFDKRDKKIHQQHGLHAKSFLGATRKPIKITLMQPN